MLLFYFIIIIVIFITIRYQMAIEEIPYSGTRR